MASTYHELKRLLTTVKNSTSVKTMTSALDDAVLQFNGRVKPTYTEKEFNHLFKNTFSQDLSIRSMLFLLYAVANGLVITQIPIASLLLKCLFVVDFILGLAGLILAHWAEPKYAQTVGNHIRINGTEIKSFDQLDAFTKKALKKTPSCGSKVSHTLTFGIPR